MITTADDAAMFREECLKWQRKFGLLDWTLTFHATDDSDKTVEALCEYDCYTREATFTYYIGTPNVSHPKDNAKHEMLHLLLADTLLAAVEADNEDDKVLGREEHKLIERLCKVL